MSSFFTKHFIRGALAPFLVLACLVNNSYAMSVTYEVTLNAELNNAGGSFGGNLNALANQMLNLTVVFEYSSKPDFSVAPDVLFPLLSVQVFDNTNGLASAVGDGGLGSTTRWRYDSLTCLGATLDCQVGGTFPLSGGAWVSPASGAWAGEYGSPLAPTLPSGNAFDAVVNANALRLIVRGGISSDNIGGLIGRSYDQGVATFSSSATSAPIPEPSTMLLFGSGLAGLIGWRRWSSKTL